MQVSQLFLSFVGGESVSQSDYINKLQRQVKTEKFKQKVFNK